MATAQRSWTALGCRVDVAMSDASRIDAACAAIRGVLDDVDLAFSRFRADSELCRLNASAERRVRVSPLLAAGIQAGIKAGRQTGGAVDLTVGRAMRRIGYGADLASTGWSAPLRLTVESVPGWWRVRVDPAGQTVERPAGVEIDLGSVGKALAADLAAAAASAATGTGVLVSLGGDIATAGEAPTEGWLIAVAEDSRVAPEDADEAIGIRGGGVATSSTVVRRWTHDGRVYHHLIDPATGLPVRGGWRTVSVAAGTCVDANTAATAAIVRGSAATEWLEAVGLPARLVSDHGEVRYVGSWPIGATA
jgi:thiamine biosynthesis lipoprotein ApbE